jgi:hypothetical protein
LTDDDPDFQSMIRARIAQGLAAPIDDPEADGFRRKLLAGAEIPVDEDGRLADAEPAPKPTSCYEHASGTWIHKPGHPGCPSFLHGKLPSRRRMIP